MSRTVAQNAFTETDLAAQTAGVICRKDKGVIDEIPAAYKDINQVMANWRVVRFSCTIRRAQGTDVQKIEGDGEHGVAIRVM